MPRAAEATGHYSAIRPIFEAYVAFQPDEGWRIGHEVFAAFGSALCIRWGKALMVPSAADRRLGPRRETGLSRDEVGTSFPSDVL